MLLYHIPLVWLSINVLENSYNKIFSEVKKNKEDIIDNVMGIYHACYITIFSTLFLTNYISTEIYDCSIFHSMIYNLIDMIKLLKRENTKLKYQMMFHHFLLTSGCFCKIYILTEDRHTLYIAFNYLTEMSTPTLNLSQILYHLDLKHTMVFKISMVFTLVLYFVFRILLQTYLLYIQSFDNDMETLLKIYQISLFSLNLYWFRKIVKLVFKYF